MYENRDDRTKEQPARETEGSGLGEYQALQIKNRLESEEEKYTTLCDANRDGGHANAKAATSEGPPSPPGDYVEFFEAADYENLS